MRHEEKIMPEGDKMQLGMKTRKNNHETCEKSHTEKMRNVFRYEDYQKVTET